MKIGIVLGAGGPFGWSYHLGVLDGIHAALGCDLRSADRVIGTSAGGHIAAAILSGADVESVLALAGTPPSDEEKQKMLGVVKGKLKHPLRAMRPMAPGLALKPHQVGVVTALVGLLPSGLFPTTPLRDFDLAQSDEWPPTLWIPSVRVSDGQLVVFGRDTKDVPLADAIEATAAVPGMFAPKAFAGERYVDGAVASATHADLLVGQGFDVVVISSPMTKPGQGPVRARAQRHLNAEVAQLEAEGTLVTVMAPSSGVVEAGAGYPRERPEAGETIVAAARHQTIQEIESRVR